MLAYLEEAGEDQQFSVLLIGSVGWYYYDNIALDTSSDFYVVFTMLLLCIFAKVPLMDTQRKMLFQKQYCHLAAAQHLL